MYIYIYIYKSLTLYFLLYLCFIIEPIFYLLLEGGDRYYFWLPKKKKEKR